MTLDAKIVTKEQGIERGERLSELGRCTSGHNAEKIRAGSIAVRYSHGTSARQTTADEDVGIRLISAEWYG